jgi:LacI family transcriptional regulator
LGKSANRSPELRSSTTLRDVAREAGVHPSTASRALNEATRAMVNAETVARVHQAADRLGYLPDAMARGLKMKRTFTVGMLIPDLTNPLFPPIARGIEDVLGAAGYTLVLASTDNDPAKERAVAEVMLNRRVDGLILATARREYPLVEELAASGPPVVLVNRTMDDAPAPAVVGDDHVGVGMAVRHLVELGHTRIAHVAGPRTLSTGLTRYQSFVSWMHGCGLEAPEELLSSAEWFQENPGAEAFGALLDGGAEFTAVVAGNDLIALGCYDALRERGLSVPGDVSVVGYNDIPFSDKLSPPLTTVRIPHYRLGVKSAELLLERLDKPEEPPVSVLLRPAMVLRESTAPPG